MLRHLLFPIFVQSIEKYADQRPQQLLAQVAEGNDPANFVFCLNKVDQLVAREGTEATQTLAADYARRLRSLLKLPGEPQVYRVSAVRSAGVRPSRAAADAGTRSRSRDRQAFARTRRRTADTSRSSAGSNRSGSTTSLHMPIACGAFARRTRAKTSCSMPINGRVLPRLAEDAMLRGEIVDAAARRRIARWPIVNVIDVLLGPIDVAVSPAAWRALTSTRANVRAIVGELTPPLDANVRSLFADLRRRDPSIADAYDTPPPWDDIASESSAAELAARLADAMDDAQASTSPIEIGRGHGVSVRAAALAADARRGDLVPDHSAAAGDHPRPGLDVGRLDAADGVAARAAARHDVPAQKRRLPRDLLRPALGDAALSHHESAAERSMSQADHADASPAPRGGRMGRESARPDRRADSRAARDWSSASAKRGNPCRRRERPRTVRSMSAACRMLNSNLRSALCIPHARSVAHRLMLRADLRRAGAVLAAPSCAGCSALHSVWMNVPGFSVRS